MNNQTNAQHTPTPRMAILVGDERVYALREDRTEAPPVFVMPIARKDEMETIVRACNAHDDLVAALRELIDDADASGVTAHFKGRGFDESIEKARAALAKAGAA